MVSILATNGQTQLRCFIHFDAPASLVFANASLLGVSEKTDAIGGISRGEVAG